MSTPYEDAIDNIRKARRLVEAFHAQAGSFSKGHPLREEWDTFASEVDALHDALRDKKHFFDRGTQPEPQKL